MKKFFIDIETLPAPEERWPQVRRIFDEKITAKFKDEETIRQKQEEAYRKTSLSGDFGRILCIGMIVEGAGRENEQVLGWDQSKRRFSEDEPTLLRAFWRILAKFDPRQDVVIGHNIFDFDLKFIYQRSVVQCVRPTVELNFRRYQNRPIFDTAREWTKWDMQQYVSLDRLALALGLPSSKTEEVSGNKVYDLYKAGKFAVLRDYCLADVRLTREIYRRMTFAAQPA